LHGQADPGFRGPAKFELNRCNESPLRGEKPDLWPVSKSNTGSLPLRGIVPVTNKQTNKNKQTPHFRTYSRRALYDLPKTLDGDRARRAHHKRCNPFFDITYSFSYTEKFGLIYRRAVSPQ